MIPESAKGPHKIIANSKKLLDEGYTKLDGTISALPEEYIIVEATTGTAIKGVADIFQVKPSFIVNPDFAKIGELVNITGFGWAASTPQSEKTISISVAADSFRTEARKIPAILETNNKGSFSGQFRIPEFSGGILGRAFVIVRDKDENEEIEFIRLQIFPFCFFCK